MKEVLFASFPGIKNRKRDRQFEYPPVQRRGSGNRRSAFDARIKAEVLVAHRYPYRRLVACALSTICPKPSAVLSASIRSSTVIVPAWWGGRKSGLREAKALSSPGRTYRSF